MARENVEESTAGKSGGETEGTGAALVPVADVEVVEEPQIEVDAPADEQQLQFDFADKISDAVWTVRVDARKRAIDQVVKGLVSLGFNHNEVATILIRLQKDTTEMDLALVELTTRQGAKGQK